jgi:hypothetical protein
MDNGRMDLPKRRQGEMFRAKLPEEKFPIFPHARARLALRESEVQPRRPPAAHPTPAGTEGVDQPGITGDARVLDPGQPATRDDL